MSDPAPTLGRQTARAVQWNTVGAVANAVLQLAVLAAMARLVAPAAFGILAMGQLVLRFFGYFAGIGVGVTIVRKQDLTARDWRAALVLSAGSGCLLAGLAWFMAPALPLLPDSPDFVWVVRILAVGLAISSLGIPSQALLTKNLRFGGLAVIEVSSYAVAYGFVGIPLAIAGWGVWALAGASLMQSSVVSLACVAAARADRPRDTGASGSFVGMFSFGAQHSAAGFVEFLGNSVDQFAAGRFLGSAVLGLYNRSLMLVNLPVQFLANVVLRVLLPVFGHLQGDREALRRTYLRTIAAVSLVAIPPAMAAAPLARELLAVVLGPAWAGGWPGLVAYAAIAPIAMLTGVAFTLGDVLGPMRRKVGIQIAVLLWMALAAACSLQWGIVGLAAATVSGYTARAFLAFVWVHRVAGVATRAFLAALVPGIAVGAACAIASALCAVAAGRLPPLAAVGIAAAVEAPLALGIILCFRLPHVAELAGMLARTHPLLAASAPARALLRRVL